MSRPTEYDGYYDVYGHSVDDEYTMSPSSVEREFTFDRSRQQNMDAFLHGDTIAEEQEAEVRGRGGGLVGMVLLGHRISGVGSSSREAEVWMCTEDEYYCVEVSSYQDPLRQEFLFACISLKCHFEFKWNKVAVCGDLIIALRLHFSRCQ